MNLGCEVGLEADKLHLGTTILLELGILALLLATKLTLGKPLPCKSEAVKPNPFPVRVLRASFSVPLSITEAIEPIYTQKPQKVELKRSFSFPWKQMLSRKMKRESGKLGLGKEEEETKGRSTTLIGQCGG